MTVDVSVPCGMNRALATADGDPGRNHPRTGCKPFFTQVAPAMRLMSDLPGKRRAPAGIVTLGVPPHGR